MARLHKLECHYCGRRSDIIDDGNVKQWQCKMCEAMNYLDENGEVADPPTSDTSSYQRETSNQVQYARAPRRPGPPRPRAPPEEPLFCSVCIRNQQLFTTSLAQYLPDDSDPDYEALYKNYYKFRRNLEKLYPQICTECEPRVIERMKQAGYTAKTDCLRRLLEKSKKSRIPGPSYKFSWASLFAFLGLLLWTSGLLIQVLWNILGCFGSQTAATLARFVPQSEFLVVIPYFQSTWTVPPAILHFCSLMLPYLYSANGAPSSVRNSLIMSTVSIWWNPEYKNSVRGFNEHISGYQEWYKMQVLSITFRFFFWIIMRRDWFGTGDAVVVKASHSFMLIMTVITSFIAYSSINVDHSRIFVYTPDKLKRYVQPKTNSPNPATAPAQLFARKDRAPVQRMTQPLFPQNASSAPVKKNIDFNDRPPLLDNFIRELNSKRHSPPSQNSFRPSFSQSRNSSFDATQSSPQAIKDRTQLTALENTLQPNFGNLAVRANRPAQIGLQLTPQSEGDMDWEPMNMSHASPARALQVPATKPSTSFETAPVVQPEHKGAFWHRVPPAPRSQNAKLRNPITPGFTSTSEEQKENFFQSMSGKKGILDIGGALSDNDSYEMNMVEPKFFPPESARYADDGLSELMSQSFTLKEKVESEVEQEEEEKGRRWWHLLFVVIVTTIFGAYIYFSTPSYEDLYQEILALSYGGSTTGGMEFGDNRKWNSDYR